VDILAEADASEMPLHFIPSKLQLPDEIPAFNRPIRPKIEVSTDVAQFRAASPTPADRGACRTRPGFFWSISRISRGRHVSKRVAFTEGRVS
jgi:hypothetical protein